MAEFAVPLVIFAGIQAADTLYKWGRALWDWIRSDGDEDGEHSK